MSCCRLQAVPPSHMVLRRLRTRYNQTMTATGRLNMDELNMQVRQRGFGVGFGPPLSRYMLWGGSAWQRARPCCCARSVSAHQLR